jgi:hypothetical protein
MDISIHYIAWVQNAIWWHNIQRKIILRRSRVSGRISRMKANVQRFNRARHLDLSKDEFAFAHLT